MWRALWVLFILAGCGASVTEYPGQSFLGAKYLNSPLGEEKQPDNDPLIRFDAFDCTTFVETVLAHADKDQLNKIRYRDGVVDFLMRNHFIETDWLSNNSNLVQNVSSKYGPTKKRRVIIDKANWFRKVHGIDTDFAPVSASIEYVPYEYALSIKAESTLVVLFITDNPKIHDTIGTDLAVVHMGFLLPNGVMRHASSKQRAVVDVNMADYVAQRMKNKENLGIALLEIK